MMEIAIIASAKDKAGINIRDRLLEDFRFQKSRALFFGNEKFNLSDASKNISLYTIGEDTVHFESAENDIQADLFIFATRHQSKSGEKTLSMHFPGNFRDAEFGGRSRELSTAAVKLLKAAFIILNGLGKDSGYNLTMEATHHGPFMSKPSMFIEIGSNEEEWEDRKAGKIIAATIIKSIAAFEKTDAKVAIGFGGLHYCQEFNKIESSSDVMMGHICPKYSIDEIDAEIVKKMIDASGSKVDFALLDWKGMDAGARQKLISIFKELKLDWKKTKEF